MDENVKNDRNGQENPNGNKNHHNHNRYNHRRKPHGNRPQGQQGGQVQQGQNAPEASSVARAQNTDAPQNSQQSRQNHNYNHRRPNRFDNRAPKNTRPDAPTPEQTQPFRDEDNTSLRKDDANDVIFIETPVEKAPDSIPEGAVKTGAPDIDLFNYENDTTSPAKDTDEPTCEVIGVKFRRVGKVYFFDPGKLKIAYGSYVIVETARGQEYGEVCFGNRRIAEKDIVQPLRPVVRIATKEDAAHNDDNRRAESDAFNICREKIAKHGLEMKLVEAQYTFDNSKLLFYFTAAGRVDFRELVKDLASVFRTRIELRQIGIRDEAKLLGGLGACGRPLCCASFLSDFVQVSIKMAKEQNLSLNSSKISGSCGRLMCCLRYENDIYEEEIRKMPPIDSVVRTPDGNGNVTEISPLSGMMKVRLDGDAGIKSYHRDQITIISRAHSAESDDSDAKNEQ